MVTVTVTVTVMVMVVVVVVVVVGVVVIVTFITTLPNTRRSLGTSMTSVMNVINVGKQQACKHAS